jgi:hypothetical protein
VFNILWTFSNVSFSKFDLEGKRPLRRSRCKWEDIKMDLTETGFEGVDCTHLAQNRDWWQALVITVMNILVP